MNPLQILMQLAGGQPGTQPAQPGQPAPDPISGSYQGAPFSASGVDEDQEGLGVLANSSSVTPPPMPAANSILDQIRAQQAGGQAGTTAVPDQQDWLTSMIKGMVDNAKQDWTPMEPADEFINKALYKRFGTRGKGGIARDILIDFIGGLAKGPKYIPLHERERLDAEKDYQLSTTRMQARASENRVANALHLAQSSDQLRNILQQNNYNLTQEKTALGKQLAQIQAFNADWQKQRAENLNQLLEKKITIEEFRQQEEATRNQYEMLFGKIGSDAQTASILSGDAARFTNQRYQPGHEFNATAWKDRLQELFDMKKRAQTKAGGWGRGTWAIIPDRYGNPTQVFRQVRENPDTGRLETREADLGEAPLNMNDMNTVRDLDKASALTQTVIGSLTDSLRLGVDPADFTGPIHGTGFYSTLVGQGMIDKDGNFDPTGYLKKERGWSVPQAMFRLADVHAFFSQLNAVTGKQIAAQELKFMEAALSRPSHNFKTILTAYATMYYALEILKLAAVRRLGEKPLSPSLFISQFVDQMQKYYETAPPKRGLPPRMIPAKALLDEAENPEQFWRNVPGAIVRPIGR